MFLFHDYKTVELALFVMRNKILLRIKEILEYKDIVFPKSQESTKTKKTNEQKKYYTTVFQSEYIAWKDQARNSEDIWLLI